MPRQGDLTVDSLTSVISDYRSTVIVSHRSQIFYSVVIPNRLIFVTVMTRNLRIQSLGESSSMKFWPRKRYWGVSTKWLCEYLCQEFHSFSCRTSLAWGRHYWSPRGTIIGSVHLRCYLNLWLPILRSMTNCILKFYLSMCQWPILPVRQ